MNAAPRAHPTRLVYASLSDVGRTRKNNEDTVGDPTILSRVVGGVDRMRARGALFAVADGMGGHARGELASHLAVATLFSAYYKSAAAHSDALLHAMDAANGAVYMAGSAKRDMEKTSPLRMGTTLVAAVVLGKRLLVANVGDSRAYLLKEGGLTQLTEDHSLVAEEVRLGMLDEEEARSAPFRNVLTRALGSEKESRAELFEASWSVGDTLLLSSDGLHGVVDRPVISTALAERPAGAAARRLVEAANSAGGPDNVSVVIARLERL